ncbi:ACT domain-containing protein ACR6-like [Zingiber officinale]|uniref:ACT domain-containing protein ACR6-like n=1 Tax=Zingiber officinale TaxID=94328 RepID=UPI001C4CD449|nr:ACT domain-containing protein ACR6-like [Zingiber officinale]XP_042410701.1 ACT domain-containing protein ACR6-like [Zingiber officinale]
MSVLSEALRFNNYDPNTLLHACGVSIVTAFTQVGGIVLQPPQLRVGNGEDFIPSRGRWNFNQKKIERQKDLDNIKECIQKSIGEGSSAVPSRRRYVDLKPSSNHTSIELTGIDRPGLLSEVSVVLTDLNCNVVSAEVWTQNTRAAAVMQVNDEMNSAITDPQRLSRIKQLLFNWFWQGLFCGHNTV